MESKVMSCEALLADIPPAQAYKDVFVSISKALHACIQFPVAGCRFFMLRDRINCGWGRVECLRQACYVNCYKSRSDHEYLVSLFHVAQCA